jgi:multiple sugar transport system substrate-binding protein
MQASNRGIRAAAAAAVTAAALALGVTACGGDDSSSSSGAVKGQTIEYWASNQGATIQQDQQVINEAIARFKKESGVTVKFKVIPWADLWNNITTATTSGKGPDVLNIGNTWSASLQATGAFMPFDDDTLKTIGGKDKFLQTSYSASGAPGKTPTSVPLYGLSYALFYNKKLFKDAGLQPPKTWSEFVDTGKKLTKDTNGDGKPDQWGFAMEGGSITENSHFAFILGRQNGGELFDGNKPTFDSDPIVKGVSDYVNLIGRDKVADPGNAQYADGTRTAGQFAKGKTGMMIYQNNAENNLKSEGMKKSEYGVAELPVADGSDTPVMTHVAGINLSVFTNTKKKAAALEFVKFLTSPGEQVKLNQSFGSLPVVKQAQSDPAFSSPNLKTFNGILAEHAEPMPLIPEEGQMETIIGGAMKQLISDSATKGPVSDAQVKAALKAANDKMAAAAGG